MKTTNKNFEAQALSTQEMRVVEGGWIAQALGVAAVVIGGAYLLYRDYQDAKNEVITGEYECPCQSNN